MVYGVPCNKSTTETKMVFTCENNVRIKVVYLILALRIGHISKYLKKKTKQTKKQKQTCVCEKGCSRRQQS